MKLKDIYVYYTAQDKSKHWLETIYGDELFPASKKLLNPLKQLAFYPTLAKLVDNDFVVIVILAATTIPKIVLVAVYYVVELKVVTKFLLN